MKTEIIIENDIEYTVLTDKIGDCRWYVNDQLHRVNGPAVIFVQGRLEWWYHGIHASINNMSVISKEEFDCCLKLRAFE